MRYNVPTAVFSPIPRFSYVLSVILPATHAVDHPILNARAAQERLGTFGSLPEDALKIALMVVMSPAFSFSYVLIVTQVARLVMDLHRLPAPHVNVPAQLSVNILNPITPAFRLAHQIHMMTRIPAKIVTPLA